MFAVSHRVFNESNQEIFQDYVNHLCRIFESQGHDTTTTSMSFCLYALSLNQSVQVRKYYVDICYIAWKTKRKKKMKKHYGLQNKVVKEIKSVLLKKGELTHADFYSMNYLSCVIKESMRIYPTIPVISRKITEEVKLPSKRNIISEQTFFFWYIHKF